MKIVKCLVQFKTVIGTEYQEGRFIGVFQHSHLVGESPLIHGHKGGVVAYPVAVVEIDGELGEFKLSDVQLETEVSE